MAGTTKEAWKQGDRLIALEEHFVNHPLPNVKKGDIVTFLYAVAIDSNFAGRVSTGETVTFRRASFDLAPSIDTSKPVVDYTQHSDTCTWHAGNRCNCHMKPKDKAIYAVDDIYVVGARLKEIEAESLKALDGKVIEG